MDLEKHILGLEHRVKLGVMVICLDGTLKRMKQSMENNYMGLIMYQVGSARVGYPRLFRGSEPVETCSLLLCLISLCGTDQLLECHIPVTPDHWCDGLALRTMKICKICFYEWASYELSIFFSSSSSPFPTPPLPLYF